MSKYIEPIYDDWQLENISQQEVEALVAGLVDYALMLRNNVASLREQINELTLNADKNANIPFYEPYSDICLTFEDFAAFSKFKSSLSRFINE